MNAGEIAIERERLFTSWLRLLMKKKLISDWKGRYKEGG